MNFLSSQDCAFCCGAIEIGNFSGGEDWQDEQDEVLTYKEMLDEIRSTLAMAKRQGYSVVFATTMSNQPTAAKALSDVGFYTTKPFNKTSPGRGDKRKMQAWFLPLVEYKGK